MYINWKHLNEAKKAANKESHTAIKLYFWHWQLAMREAVFLFLMFVGSMIHAFFPFLLDFKLLEWRIKRLKNLKSNLPDDPNLKKIYFE